MKNTDEIELTEHDKQMQDLYSEIRYIAYVIEGVANTMKKLAEEIDGRKT